MTKKQYSRTKAIRPAGILILVMIAFSCMTPSPVPEEESISAPVTSETQIPVTDESEPGDGSLVQPAESREPGDGSLVSPAVSEPESFTELVPETWGLGEPSPCIDAPGIKSPYQLYQFFMANRPDADGLKVARLASYYVEEGLAEGINSDVAFVQMCLETGWLSFGNLVTEDMNNFCGLGAIDEENRGNVFESERMGVRAHIQHLHAYGTTRELNRTCIDVRYKWVNPRGKAPTVDGLSGTWAADRTYGSKLQNLLDRLAEF